MEKIRKKTGRAGKVKRGRPAVNTSRAVVVDSLGQVSPEVMMQDSCLRAWLRLGSVRAVADALGISVGLAHRHISEGSAYLREAGSPAHRAAVLGLVKARCNHLWAAVNGALELCIASGQIDKVAALAGAGARLCELMARFHGIGSDAAPSAVVNEARSAEVARRLALVGVHSRGREVVERSVAAGEKIADAVGVEP